jgi:DNA-binding XRE family transcriptional regulator
MQAEKIKGYTLFHWRGLPVCVVGVPKRFPHQRIIGDSIRKHRKAAGMSQEKTAEKADLHPVYFGQVERGEQEASVRALMRIAKALRVKLRDLVNEV